MTQPLQAACRNGLLKALPADDFALLQPYLTNVDLTRGDLLIALNACVEHVQFVEHGIVSLVAVALDGQEIEVGMIGSEGMVGLPILSHAAESPNEARVQTLGQAWSIPSGALHQALRQSPALHRLLLRYGQTVLSQFAYTALAGARYKLEQRLARWLLMCHDRADGDALPATHRVLSIILGVNRPGLTLAVASLERAGIIATRRGRITVRERKRLLTIAGAAYGGPESEYLRLIAG